VDLWFKLGSCEISAFGGQAKRSVSLVLCSVDALGIVLVQEELPFAGFVGAKVVDYLL